MVLMISYDLIGPERPKAYETIKAAIESGAISSIRPLFSQWLVETTSDAQGWVKHLQATGAIDANDRLLVLPVVRPFWGLLLQADWDWLNARV
jgi:hypothetical protein